jgi:spermidine/putrescine transport system permease protein
MRHGRLVSALVGAPGVAWLGLLFLVPLYAVICVAFGHIDPILGTAVPTWSPLQWNPGYIDYGLHQFLPGHSLFAVAVRTAEYVGTALALCIVIAYPVAYYLARQAKRTKPIMLVLLGLPFLTNYLMRMVAWIDLLGQSGYVNQILVRLHVLNAPYGFLEGHSGTVIFGLVYGYILLMVLPLYIVLDRVEPTLLEAARDLGAGPITTFWRITVPLSLQGVIAGSMLVALPMFGDYYTADLMSGSPSTTMLGNQITLFVQGGTEQTLGAALVVILSGALAIIGVLYLVAVARASRVAT